MVSKDFQGFYQGGKFKDSSFITKRKQTYFVLHVAQHFWIRSVSSGLHLVGPRRTQRTYVSIYWLIDL